MGSNYPVDAWLDDTVLTGQAYFTSKRRGQRSTEYQTDTEWHTKNKNTEGKVCATATLSIQNNNAHYPPTRPGTRRRDAATHSQPASYTIDISYSQS
jgi:hypothetical protein